MIFAGLHGNWMGMGVVEMKSAGVGGGWM